MDPNPPAFFIFIRPVFSSTCGMCTCIRQRNANWDETNSSSDDTSVGRPCLRVSLYCFFINTLVSIFGALIIWFVHFDSVLFNINFKGKCIYLYKKNEKSVQSIQGSSVCWLMRSTVVFQFASQEKMLNTYNNSTFNLHQFLVNAVAHGEARPVSLGGCSGPSGQMLAPVTP